MNLFIHSFLKILNYDCYYLNGIRCLTNYFRPFDNKSLSVSLRLSIIRLFSNCFLLNSYLILFDYFSLRNLLNNLSSLSMKSTHFLHLSLNSIYFNILKSWNFLKIYFNQIIEHFVTMNSNLNYHNNHHIHHHWPYDFWKSWAPG